MQQHSQYLPADDCNCSEATKQTLQDFNPCPLSFLGYNIPVSIFARIVLEHFRNASSTFSPVLALVSRNISSVKKQKSNAMNWTEDFPIAYLKQCMDSSETCNIINQKPEGFMAVEYLDHALGCNAV
jgi:hypothetical protein